MDDGYVLISIIIYLAIVVLVLISWWIIFSKAGQPGWACLIPLYNIYVCLKVAGKPGWWLVMFFIPIANFVIWILTLAGIAKNFGKGSGFVVGMLFLPFIFLPILAFSDARYTVSIE